MSGKYKPSSVALRRSSREIVPLSRPRRLAISPREQFS
ncbi:hypothetical protein CKA32_006657 [Geitlerinema sp. FC II]|nr:hypothetical protein CKA32_006657 [Geitlerinema sp. FC II]